MGEEHLFENEIDRIDHEAAEWLARSSRGLSSVEQQDYDQWLARDERHREWTEAHAVTRSGLGMLVDLLSDDGEEPDPDFFAPLSARPSRHKWFLPASIAALAASIAVVFFVSQPSGTALSGGSSEYSNAFAAIAFERHFLEDGTLIELKAGSAVEVRFDSGEREIRLIRGEVHFSVAKDLQRPFVVHAGTAAFWAIGTAFNVRLSSDGVELLVTEGVVRIDKSISVDDIAKHTEPLSYSEELEANQRATISFALDESAPRIETISDDVIDQELVWKHEILEFEATRLSDAVQVFNQRNRDQIEIADRSLGDEQIDGTFRSDNLAGFVKLLEISAGIEVDRSEHGKIVFRRKAN